MTFADCQVGCTLFWKSGNTTSCYHTVLWQGIIKLKIAEDLNNTFIRPCAEAEIADHKGTAVRVGHQANLDGRFLWIYVLIKSGSIPANVSHTLAFLSNYVRRSAANWSWKTRAACDAVQMKVWGRCGAELFMLALLKRDQVVESDIKNDLEPLLPFIIQPLKK